MKRLIASLFCFAFASAVALAQVGPQPYALNQYTYTDSTGHTVPFAIAYCAERPITAIFDPSTSATDQAHAWSHMTKANGIAGYAPTQQQVLPGVVNAAIGTQITRTIIPFSVNSSTTGTTLATIPFSVATVLQTNCHYTFRADLFVSLGAGGSKIDVGGTCNTSNFVAEYLARGGTTSVYGGQLLSFLSGPSGASNSTATEIVIEGELDVTNGGTFVIQFAQNGSNATNSTVLAGSTLAVTQIP
jgi:hypothetical protein